jgi:hypothetical protein
MPPLLFDPSAFIRDTWSKLTRDEQDGLFAFMWYERTHAATGIGTAFPVEDVSFPPEQFRPIEAAAMATGLGLTSAAIVKATLSVGMPTWPTRAKLESVIQSAKQHYWLNTP